MAVAEIVRFPEGRGAQDYDATGLDLAGDPPDGLIFHSAGEFDGRFQVFNVWESQEQAERFIEDRLRPAIKAAVGEEAFEQMPDADRTFTDVHNYEIP